MLALGIIFLLLAAALIVGVVVTGTSQEILFTSTIGNLTTQPVWIFAAGALAMLLVLLGLSFFGRGTRRGVARRREIKRLRQVEEEHTSGPIPTTRTETVESSAPVVVTERRPGYDEPDRQLVREQRAATVEPVTERPAHEPPAQPAPPTSAAYDPTLTDDGRHRDI